jgi:putative phage-type endonuclease
MIDHELRRKGIGASEVAACLAMHPYISPFDLWARKVGIADPIEPSERMKWGSLLQQAIAQGYAEVTGCPTEWVDRTEVAPNDPLVVFSMDARVEGRIVECKNISLDQVHKFGEPGTDQVPDYMALQAQWQLLGVRMQGNTIDFCDIAALFGGNNLRIFTIEFNEKIAQDLHESARSFWDRHVVANDPPSLTDTDAARAYLMRRWPKANGNLRQPTHDELVAVKEFDYYRSVAKGATAKKEALAIQLKALIGDSDGFLWDAGKATNKNNKPSLVTDWEKAFALLREAIRVSMTANGLHSIAEGIDKVAADAYGVCTQTKPGPRVLRVTMKGQFDKEE